MQETPTFGTVTVRIHPAAARYIDNHFPLVSGAYDIRKSPLHAFVSAFLQKSDTDFRSHASRRTETREVRLAVTAWDCEHYGDTVTAKSQLAISQHIYKTLLREACLEVMVMHTAGGIPRDTAIKNHLARNLYEDSELNYPALRKYYQRHFTEAERRFAEDLEEEGQRTRKRR